MNTAKRQKQRKVLLMGKSGAGKSSMRSIVFSNYVAKDVRRLGATIDVEHSNIRFMGNLMLNLWDCGGQDGFMENYLTHQRETVFSSVAVLIFVFDIESREFQSDVVNYSNIIRALGECSPNAKVFCLVHKMDLVQEQNKQRIFEEKCSSINKASEDFEDQVQFFPTSIWDQSLYKAWTQIIKHLIPNNAAIESLLEKLAEIIEAREILLYERTTCLMVTNVTRDVEADNPYPDRFESMSSILKTHKQSLARHTQLPTSSAQFFEMHIKTASFMLFVMRLTENTNLMAILPPSEQLFNTARLNIQQIRPRFQELDLPTRPKGNGGMNSSEQFMAGAAKDVDRVVQQQQQQQQSQLED